MIVFIKAILFSNRFNLKSVISYDFLILIMAPGKAACNVVVPSSLTEESKDINIKDINASEEKEECIICLDNIKSKGNVNSCNHSFCFDCIRKYTCINIFL